jgi:hypothetical protein
MSGTANGERTSFRSAAATSVDVVRALILAFPFISGLLIVGSTPGLAEPSQSQIRLNFDIPAQSIAGALDAYSAVTGREIFYDGALVVGRRSTPVQGIFAPGAALTELLVGTGLVARATGQASFTLASSPVAAPDYLSYFAVLQRTVSRVLCGHAETRPGDVDRLLQIWIAPAGTVQRTRFLDAPDDRAGADTFAAALRGVSIGVPPSDMPQPVVLAILAQTATECSDSRVGSR